MSDGVRQLHHGASFVTRDPIRASLPLRLLVGVQGEGLNGIDTYAEQVAVAGQAVGCDVTLVVTSDAVADAVRARIDPAIHLLSLALPLPDRAQALAGRLWHGVAMQRLADGLTRTLAGQGGMYDVAHLNHPALAPYVRSAAGHVVVTAWFYPHAPWRRLASTWAHNRGPTARRAVLAVKSLSYFRGDADGYSAADQIVAPTEVLVRQLQSRGLPARWCPPPVRVGYDRTAARSARRATVRLVAVSGDLSHPRKNLGDALEVAALLARADRPVALELIGRNPGALRSRATALPACVDVSFPGALARGELHRRVREADVLVFPSLYEEWGYVAVEALLLGTPVATYPVYPFESMLEGGLGAIASGHAPRELAAAIEPLLATPRDPALADAAAARFGADAVGVRLASIWGQPARA